MPQADTALSIQRLHQRPLAAVFEGASLGCRNISELAVGWHGPISLQAAVNALGLWKVADFVKTGGKGYRISEGDGLSYSYSVFSDYKQIKDRCKSVHILNITGAINPYRSASHVALLGLKK
jgi:hypothetical protein